jgi:xylulokinase
MPIVAGIDSSPSTTRVVVCDALSGKVMRKAAVAHAAAADDDPH